MQSTLFGFALFLTIGCQSVFAQGGAAVDELPTDKQQKKNYAEKMIRKEIERIEKASREGESNFRFSISRLSELLPLQLKKTKSSSSTTQSKSEQQTEPNYQSNSVQQDIEIRSINGHGIQLNAFNVRGIDSTSHARQIIVEMKKGLDPANDDAIRGVFAEESWIDSNSGVIQFYDFDAVTSVQPQQQFWIGVRCVEFHSESSRTETKNKEKRPNRSNRKSSKDQLLIVDEVVPNSAASDAGVQVKDKIVKWNNLRVNSVQKLVDNIQRNRTSAATISVMRAGKAIDLKIKPQAREIRTQQVRTIFAPSTEVDIAEKRIDLLHEMIVANNIKNDQPFRLVIVGPGVNFGKEEVELQLKPNFHEHHSNLNRIIDRVTENKYSIVFNHDKAELSEASEIDVTLNLQELVPEQIWQSFEIGSNGKSMAFSMIAPQVLVPSEKRIRLADFPNRSMQHDLTAKKGDQRIEGDFHVGRFVFESPHRQINLDRNDTLLNSLQIQYKQMKAENEILKAELNLLKKQLTERK